jgi:hypothetical protein
MELDFNLQSGATGRLLEVTVEGCSPDGTPHPVSATLELDVRPHARVANLDAQRELLLLQGDAARSEARRHADTRSTASAIAILQQTLARIDALPGFVPNDGSLLGELREQIHDEAASYGRHATHTERAPGAHRGTPRNELLLARGRRWAIGARARGQAAARGSAQSVSH